MSQEILTDEFLEHHGVKGMHWYQRRYQNPDGTLTEAGKRRYARHQAKLDTKINNAVTTGDKKKLSKLQDKMSSEQYEENYKKTVANGIQNAIMDRSKRDLRKYKEDLDPRTYKQTKKRIDFKAAVDEGDNKTIRKLSSQVKPEDIAEATQFINARLTLKESELKRIRQDTELMAQVDAITNKINTGAKFLGSVANVAKNTNAILNEYDTFTKRGSKSESDKLSSEVINKLKEDLPNMSNEELRETLKVLNSGGGGSKKKDDKAKHSDFDPEEFLEHHGIKGMHWGIRRYQPYPKGYNGDGKFTPEQQKYNAERYQKYVDKSNKSLFKHENDFYESLSVYRKTVRDKNIKKAIKNYNKNSESFNNTKKLKNDLDKAKSAAYNEYYKKYKQTPEVMLEDMLTGRKPYNADPFDASNYRVKMFEKHGATKINSEIAENKKKYEKESRKFINDLLGEYGDKELTLKGDTYIKYDIKKGEIKRNTNADQFLLAMLYQNDMLWDK